METEEQIKRNRKIKLMVIKYIKDHIDYQYEHWLENDVDSEVEFKLSKVNLEALEEITDNEPSVNVDSIMENAMELLTYLRKEEGIQKPELLNSGIQRFELEDYLKMPTKNYLILKKLEAIFIYLYKIGNPILK